MPETKKELVNKISQAVLGNQHEYRRLIETAVENELMRWKKEDLEDFME